MSMFFNMSKEDVRAEYNGIITNIRFQLDVMEEAMTKQNNVQLTRAVFPILFEADKLSALERFAPLPFECGGVRLCPDKEDGKGE